MNERESLLQAPNEENLLSGSLVLLGNGGESLVLGKRRVGGSEAGVGGVVDTLLLAVGDELGGGVVGVKLDLVDSLNEIQNTNRLLVFVSKQSSKNNENDAQGRP